MIIGQKGEINFLPNLANYFLHGVILFISSYAISWIQLSPYYWLWSSLLVVNVAVSICLLMIIGTINMIISESLWSIKVKSNAENWIVQGFLITLPTQILLLLFHPAIQLLSDNFTITFVIYVLILFFSYTMIFGFIGSKVARKYIEVAVARQKPPSFKGTRGRCPSCGESFRYSIHDISDEGTVRCLNCKQPFHIEPTEDLMKRISRNQDTDSKIDI